MTFLWCHAPMSLRRTARRALILYNLAAPVLGLAIALSGSVAEGVAVVLIGHVPWMLSTLWPSFDGFGEVVRELHGADGPREVWLTIDDGPHPEDTPVVLDLLDAFGARATFFFIGERAAAHPELVQAVLDRGHEVANHTWSHPQYTFWAFGPRAVERELLRCAETLGAIGPTTDWVRAPAGFKSPWMQHVAERMDLRVAAWSVRGRDGTSRDVEAIGRRLRAGVRPGAIVLMHESFALPDGRRLAPLVLRSLLEHLRDEGYDCVLPRSSV